jgi:molybdate transport system substrate-binding protein
MHDSSRFTDRARAWITMAAATVAILSLGRGASIAAPASDVLVFAAASLQTALDALTAPAERATGVHMRISYAASSALARQLESGAPADLFVSADVDWMNEVATRHLVRADTRADLVGNELVLIRATSASGSALKIGPGFPLAAALGANRLALADPAAVPAGKYAKAALTSLGVWASVADRIAAAEDVRAALRLVSRGEAPLGIVYRSDAVADSSVVVVDTFPASTHPPIVYPVAVMAAAPNHAGAVAIEAYLRSAAAAAVFRDQGFTVPRRN